MCADGGALGKQRLNACTGVLVSSNGLRVLVLSAAALVGACSNDLATPRAEVENGEALPAVARAFAVALADSGVRADVRDILRASPYVGHKVDLKQFLLGSTAARFLHVASSGTGLTTEQIRSLVESLPDMHVYMPRRDDRRNWRATEAVVVASAWDEEGPPTSVWDLRGRRTKVDARGPKAILVIEPVESRSLRVYPQANRPGAVIQDADDGDWGGAVSSFDARGNLVRETQLADLLRGRPLSVRLRLSALCDPEAIYCDPNEGGGAGSGGMSSDTTFVTRFWVEGGICDGWFCGPTEIEFRSHAYNENNEWVDTRYLRLEGDCWYRSWDSCSDRTNDVLMYLRMRDNTTQRIWVQVVEIDTWNNDELGNRHFYWNDNGAPRSISGGGYTSHLTLAWTAVP